MKILRSKATIATTAMLMLLSLYAFANITIFVNGAIIKNPTVYVNGSGSLELTWKSGKSQTYISDAYANLGGLDAIDIIPNHGWHVNAVFIDGNPQAILDEDGFSLINVKAISMVSVTFQENGGVDDVETGSNVEAYPNPYVVLIFTDVNGQGWTYAIPTLLQPPDAKGGCWDIQTTADFIGNVTVILVLNLAGLPVGFDPYSLTLVRTEVELRRADVNSDGVVNGTDVSIVANANPSRLGDPKYDPTLDLNDNGVIDNNDVNIVNNYIGESVWEDITSQVIVANGIVYIYGSTDHFSIFGAH